MIYTLVDKSPDGKIASVFSFDVVNSYSESWSGTVSKNTVEFGFPISDHINIENPSFDISGKLSSYSIFNSANEIIWNGNDFTQPSVATKTTTGHLIAKEKLKELFLARTTFTLIESDMNSFEEQAEAKFKEITSGYVKEYNNCVITSINFSIPENSSGGVVAVQIKLEQLNIAFVKTFVLTEQEKQKRVIPLVKPPTNVGTSATDTKDSDSPNAPKPDTVATKGGDPVNAKKAEMPADLAKELQDSETAKELAKKIDERLDNGSVEGKKVTISQHGNVYTINTEGGILR